MSTAIHRWSMLALAAAAACALGTSACATSQPAPPDSCNATLPDTPTTKVWPAAPDQARVAYVGSLSDNTGCKLGAGAAALTLSYPRSMAARADGVVFVADRRGVRAIDPKTGDMRPFATSVSNARGVAVGADGSVFVVDAQKKRVEVFAKDGAFVREIGREGELANPQGVTIDAARARLHVADSALGAVVTYTLDGALVRTIKGTATQPLGAPTQVAVNSLGELFVVHQGIPRIAIFDADGNYLRGFGPEGDQSGQFTRPKGIAIDSEDHVYVSDAAFDNVQVFDRLGQLLLFFGEAGTGTGEFNLPGMLAIDANDRVYVADFGNHRVQVLQYLGAKFDR